MSNSNPLDPSTLLASSDHRLTLQATLQPVANIERFQPAGFPEIGHVIYDAPRAVMEKKKEEDGTETEIHAKDENGDPKWTTDKVCIVDSAASMANHLETVCLAGPFGAGLADELKGLPYVECVTDGDKPGAHRLVVTTFSEGHRLASSLFTDEKNSRLLKGGKRSNENLGTNLLNEFGLVDLGKRSHPLPQDWWNVFETIFKYDPNSLVHGIFFPAMGIRIPRVLTAHLVALGAARVASAGVKFDKLLMTTSGQPIFAVDEETAREIRATFIIDLALVRSFGRVGKDDEKKSPGLSVSQKQFLLAFALWKIGRLLQQPFRYRSQCDLELRSLRRTDAAAAAELTIDSLNIDIAAAIRDAGFPANPVTQVHWPANEIFKKAKEKPERADEDQTMDDESVEESGEAVEK